MEVDLIFTLAAVFTSVALVSGSLASVALSRRAPERRRLRDLEAPDAPSVRPQELRLARCAEPLAERSLGPAGKIGRADRLRLRRRLAAAGYDQPAAAVVYLGCTGRLANPVRGDRSAAPRVWQWLDDCACSGGLQAFQFPTSCWPGRAAQRKKAIQDGLPDALDLIVVCVEAGSSLDQADLRASNELHIALPAIARELKTLATEIRAGKPRMEAFQDLARRTGVEDVRALVAMLIQTDRFGTSIAQALQDTRRDVANETPAARRRGEPARSASSLCFRWCCACCRRFLSSAWAPSL